jgi:hypothetical protein
MADLTGLTLVAGQEPCPSYPDAGCVQYYTDADGNFFKVSTSGQTGETTKEEVAELPTNLSTTTSWINKVRAELTPAQKWGIVIGVSAFAYWVLWKAGSFDSKVQ